MSPSGATRESTGFLMGQYGLVWHATFPAWPKGYRRFQAVGLAEVRRHNAVPAAVGKDGYALTVGGLHLEKASAASNSSLGC